jgi:uncharacterized protein YgbK (DUF1537 family)
MALGQVWSASRVLAPVERWPFAGRSEPLLVASGSCSPVTERQIGWALANGFADTPLDTTALATEEYGARIVNETSAHVVAQLKRGRSVVLHTSKGDADPRRAATEAVFARRGLDAIAAKAAGARLFGLALGAVVRSVVEQSLVRRVVIAGGDTSSYAARALGIESLEMLSPMAPGAPLCKVHAPGTPAEGLQIVLKGGQVGAPDFFGVVARGE